MITLADAFEHALAPPDRRAIYDWAAEKVFLPPVLTRSGPFSVHESRHFIAPFDALKDDRVREVNIQANVRSGKTLIADVFAPWAVAVDHSSILWIMQTDPLAKEHAELRALPVLESVPEVRSMLPDDRHKKRTQEIVFSNGLPLMLKGPSMSNLQSRGFKVVIGDEVWLWKPGILGNAKARLGDFVKMANSKWLGISQAGEENCDWDLQFESGVVHEWHVPCVSCGHLQRPLWSGFRADGSRHGIVFDAPKAADGSFDVPAAMRTVRYVCVACGHEHPDTAATRDAWNLGGLYVAPDGTHVGTGYEYPTNTSFHWNAIIDWPWRELVKLWLAARKAAALGAYEPTIEFWQKYLAEKKSGRTVHEGSQSFARAKIELTDPKLKAWDGEAERYLTADRQSEDTYWVTIRAWAAGTGESRRLWFGKLYSEADIEAKRIEFGVDPNCTMVDSGYRPKGDHGVYAACIRYGWIAGKGADDHAFWHSEPSRTPGVPAQRVQRPWAPLTYGDPGEGTSAEGRMECRLLRFSSPVMKDRVQWLIDRGLWIEPEGNDDAQIEREYRAQMAGEFKKPGTDRHGRRVMTWHCPSGNNHAFDCAAMQVLLAMCGELLPAGVELSNSTHADEHHHPEGSPPATEVRS